MSYKCSNCEETFDSPQSYGGHKAHCGIGKIECKYCSESFKKYHLTRHQKACPHNPKNKRYCKECKALLTEWDQNKFCSQSCAASYNNRKYPKRERKEENKLTNRKCLNCENFLFGYQEKYCCIKCQSVHFTKKRFKIIEQSCQAEFDVTHNTNAKWIKRYLIKKFGEKCMECGWNETNPFTGNIPIELDHIDGDGSNNSIKNCRLLCPNCHSLTKTYKGANLGNGRSYRKKYYTTIT